MEKYFEMLTMDSEGRSFVKAAIYRDLAVKIGSRNTKSVERKMSNISAVLVSLGFPYLRGLAPSSNYQRNLQVFVQAELKRSRIFE